jgi:AraC-like DNA-binding protein
MKRIEVFEDHAIFVSGPICTEVHKHHALEIIVSADSPIKIKGNNGIEISSKAVLVMPNESHQTTTKGQGTFIFIEPESALAMKVINAFGLDSSLKSIENQIPENLINKLSSGIISDTMFESSTLSSQLDVRIKNVIEFIRLNIISNEISLDILAEVACLSTSRLVHLFKEQIGIPLRPFILWCRMRVAVDAVLSGMTLTQAAHQAGFSDTSHLSRTFMEMFGVNPSAVLKQ